MNINKINKNYLFDKIIMNTKKNGWKFKMIFDSVVEANKAKKLIRYLYEITENKAKPTFRVRSRGKWTAKKIGKLGKIQRLNTQQDMLVLSLEEKNALVKSFTKNRVELPLKLADYVVLYVY